MPTSSDTSRSLLDRLQSESDSRDWELFYRIYQPFICRHLLARRIAPKDVDDVAQEILSRVFCAFPSFTHNGRRGAFRKWLGQIVSQQTWRHFQRLQKEAGVSPMAPGQIEESVPAFNELESWWDTEHDRYLLGRLLELIKPEFTGTTWSAFHWVAVRNLPVDQVAKKLNVSENAVVIAKSRVLKRLRVLGRDLIDSF